MSKITKTRLENAKCYFNGLQSEENLDLLRECVKSVIDEQRAARDKKQQNEKKKADSTTTEENNRRTKGVSSNAAINKTVAKLRERRRLRSL